MPDYEIDIYSPAPMERMLVGGPHHGQWMVLPPGTCGLTLYPRDGELFSSYYAAQEDGTFKYIPKPDWYESYFGSDSNQP